MSTHRTLLGHPLTPELLAILLVYFVQGIVGLSQLAVGFFLKDEIGLGPAAVAAMTGISTLPWTLKPLLGLMSDGVPLFGYRRRSYLVLAGVLGSASWITLATVVQTYGTAIAAIGLGSLSIAMSDVIIDALIVERARNESTSEVGTLQSLAWGTVALGGVMAAYAGGLLLQRLGPRWVFAITSTFPLIVAFVAGFIGESPVHQVLTGNIMRNQLTQLWQAMTQRVIWMPMVFILLWQSTPNAETAFFFFTTNDLGFQPEFLGRVQLVVSLAALLGVWIFQRFLKAVDFRTIFLWSAILSTGLGLSTLVLVTHTNRLLGINDQWFNLGDRLILAVMGKIALMPIMVLATQLCPTGVEATLFALMMAVLNLGHLISHELGAVLTQVLGVTEQNFEHLGLLVLITSLSTLLPLPWLGWLPRSDLDSEIQRQRSSPSTATDV